MTYVARIPAYQEGRSIVVTCREPGMRWTRQRRRERCGQGGSPRESETARRRTALKARLANIFPATCTCRKTLWRHAGRCVRQNRVVLAVVAAAKPSEDATSPTGGSASSIREATGVKGHRSPGTPGISRQPIAQGRPDVRPTCMLLCAHFSTHRAADRGCQPAPGLPCAFLIEEGEGDSKARAKPAARKRPRVWNSQGKTRTPGPCHSPPKLLRLMCS